jgi:hypothetical protein
MVYKNRILSFFFSQVISLIINPKNFDPSLLPQFGHTSYKRVFIHACEIIFTSYLDLLLFFLGGNLSKVLMNQYQTENCKPQKIKEPSLKRLNELINGKKKRKKEREETNIFLINNMDPK